MFPIIDLSQSKDSSNKNKVSKYGNIEILDDSDDESDFDKNNNK